MVAHCCCQVCGPTATLLTAALLIVQRNDWKTSEYSQNSMLVMIVRCIVVVSLAAERDWNDDGLLSRELAVCTCRSKVPTRSNVEARTVKVLSVGTTTSWAQQQEDSC
jgi:hypothetical protein